ncbi:MAG: VWA domain-containing protein [Proteobacteria bacterium]|nr:VWA domain-containing protein [Pseudomonadota bacterium]
MKPLLLPEREIAVIEEDAEVKTLSNNVPQAVVQDQLRKQKVAKSNLMADSYAQRGRTMHAEAMISPMVGYVAQPLQSIRAPSEAVNRENYEHFDDNQIKLVAEAPVSTFSIDVDTGAYSNVRRMINSGNLPREDAVRVEELINYFAYDYPVPENSGTPFSVTTEIGVTPWNPDTRLLHIGIKGYDVTAKELPASNLVFLVDVSGSMNSPKKLGLLKSALKLLTKQMRSEDRISIVVYAGASGVVLEPVAGNQSAKIAQALDSLSAGGSTNGAAGIRSAYQLAEQEFIRGGINRVILATDGDFNVGTVNFEALKDLVEEKRKTGISLTTLGFGTGNYNDHLMEQLADAGNGNYSYIDTLNEAQKVLVDEISSTLNTIAKDVKIQLEFNPAVVAEYRLIGYENRALNREDFNNDKIDAGEIGAGHTVTALYEVTLTNSKNKAMDPLRYSSPETTEEKHSNELANLRLRYKEPTASKSKLIEQVIKTSDIETRLANTSDRYRFSASVAGFGQLLRGGKYMDEFAYDDVLELARTSRGKDNFGYRGEFLSLVNLAKSLSSQDKDDLQASR